MQNMNGAQSTEQKRRRTTTADGVIPPALWRRSPVVPRLGSGVVEPAPPAAMPHGVAVHITNILTVVVIAAENVDESAGVFDCVRGCYQVCGKMSFLRMPECFRTKVVRGDHIFPRWNATFPMEFKQRPPVGEFVLLEVVQHLKSGDPCTSDGRAVIGRARVPVPEFFGLEGKHKAELVTMGPSGKTVGGFIWVNTKLEAVYQRVY